jgi:hypothetical protein
MRKHARQVEILELEINRQLRDDEHDVECSGGRAADRG